MVDLKIRKFGHSLGVVLPKEVINRLRTNAGEKLFLIEAEGRDYWLTSHDPEVGKKMTKAKHIMSRYPSTVRALSK